MSLGYNTANVCPKCKTIEYMAGKRIGGCTTCRGVDPNGAKPPSRLPITARKAPAIQQEIIMECTRKGCSKPAVEGKRICQEHYDIVLAGQKGRQPFVPREDTEVVPPQEDIATPEEPAADPEPPRVVAKMAVDITATNDMALELIDTKLELVINRLVHNEFEESERIIDDLDRVRELVKQVAS